MDDDNSRLGYGGSHGGVGGYMFIWRTHSNQRRYRGGDPEIGESGGGKMGYGSYKWPRTQGSSGTPGRDFSRHGAAGGAALNIQTRNMRVDGTVDMNGKDGYHQQEHNYYSGSGGGAGGSVLVQISGKLHGNGIITANGGEGGDGDMKGGVEADEYLCNVPILGRWIPQPFHVCMPTVAVALMLIMLRRALGSQRGTFMGVVPVGQQAQYIATVQTAG